MKTSAGAAIFVIRRVPFWDLVLSVVERPPRTVCKTVVCSLPQNLCLEGFDLTKNFGTVRQTRGFSQVMDLHFSIDSKICSNHYENIGEFLLIEKDLSISLRQIRPSRLSASDERRQV